MKVYRLVTSGYMVVEVQANSKEEAVDKLYDEGLNELYHQEVHEVVEQGELFKRHTDLN